MCVPFLIVGIYALVMGSPENLEKIDFDNMRRKHRILKDTSPIFRSFLARGSGLLLLCFPLFGMWHAYRCPLIIAINDDQSGTYLYKYRGLHVPTYKNFGSYTGTASYKKPYLYFSPPLICTDETHLIIMFLPNTFLLAGGKLSIETFVQSFDTPLLLK